jgi:uncharacterized RDD family membrane protein YckC
MAIKFACPTCQHAFKTDEKFAGRQATCPSCQNKLTIPNAPAAELELIPAVDRPVAYDPKPSRPAPPPSRPFDDGEFNENFNPFASPQAEDTRPSFAGIHEEAGENGPVQYAGFLARFIASIIDGLIVGGIYFVLLFLLVLNKFDAVGEDVLAVFGLILQLISIVMFWLYAALMESSSAQATLGKKWLGMKVTNLQGGPVSFGQATGRHFGKWLSQLLFCLGYFMQPFTEKKQALHDKLAGCLVIKVR